MMPSANACARLYASTAVLCLLALGATSSVVQAQPAMMGTSRVQRPPTRAIQPRARTIGLPARPVEPAPRQESPELGALASLELRLDAAEHTGAAGPLELAAIEAAANAIVEQSSVAEERIRARRILRRVRRMTGSQAPASTARTPTVQTPTLQNPVTPAAHVEHTPPQQAAIPQQAVPVQQTVPSAVPGSVMTTAPGAPCPDNPRLERFAQIAARLAQYGAPPADPALTPVPMSGLSACPTPVVCPPPPRHYLNLDALGWWVRGDKLPPLVTSAPVGTPQADAGVLGEPETSILFGDQRVLSGIRWGGRAQGGVWLDDFQTVALEGHYYGLAGITDGYARTSIFSGGSLDDPILARPYFDNNPAVNAESALLVAFPDLIIPGALVELDGTVTVREQSRIQSAGGGVRYAIGPYNAPARLFLLGAYRFFDVQESLNITSTSSAVIEPFPTDAGEFQVVDIFQTGNIFNGGEIGIGTEIGRDRWSLGAETRLAMGNMRQTVTIDGRTSAIYDMFTASYAGGLLAQPTNIGTYTRDRFALIPQVDLKLGFALFPAMRLTVGYNFTYVSSVVRPGEQVDLNVNSSQFAGQPLDGPASPSPTLADTSIWLQGFTTGVDFRF